jgi:hypothetical protein
MHQRLALYHARAAKEARHFSQGWWMHQNRHEKRAGEAGEKRVLRGGSAGPGRGRRACGFAGVSPGERAGRWLAVDWQGAQ